MSNAPSDIVIVSATRTAIGAFSGGFKTLSAATLGANVIEAVLEKSGVPANDIDEVIMGQVLTAGVGQNPARQAAMAAGIPDDKTAYTINQVCGSGLRSVATAHDMIKLGQASVMIAGGQENMTQSPHTMFLRDGVKMGNGKMVDTMVHDGLWDIFNDYHMGITAENIAEKFQITRDDQDEFAANSQQKTETAQGEGKFDDEIVPVTVKGRKEDVEVKVDEHPRHGATKEALSKLRPAFSKDGSVTAGNASGINDGAAAVVVMSREEAEKRECEPLATIKSWATAGVDPSIMGTGPVPASRKALDMAGWDTKDLDLIEANEAFAAQAISVNREMGWDTDIVNVNGGAIALGHPIGASGTRILVTLIHEMTKRDSKKGLATLCIGGGMGIAMCIERS